MELKQIKQGDKIFRPGDGRFIGYAAADGLQIYVEPFEIASYKRTFLITDIQLVQALEHDTFECPIQIKMEPVE